MNIQAKNFLLINLILVTTTVVGQTHLDSFIDSAVSKLFKETDISTLSIGIIKDNKTYLYNLGKLENGKELSNKNSFEIASITKTFTGLLLAQAVSEKKLKLDDDIRRYLFGNYSNLAYQGKPITFRHLATHMSGLPYSFPNSPEIFVNPDYDKLPFIIDSLERNFTKRDFFKALGQVKIDTLPGYKFRYSNVGANLTAYILENVYEISYEQLLQKYIFNISKMKNTKLKLSSKEELSLIQGYNTKKIKMPFFSPSIRAAGALKSTLPDMMKYISLQLKETNGAVKLSHESIWAPANSSFSMGYFWQIDSNNGNKKIFQNGGSFGTSSWIEFYPETKLGFFLMTNVSGPDIHNQLSALTQAIYKEIAAN